MTIQTVQESSKSEGSPRFFGRLKFREKFPWGRLYEPLSKSSSRIQKVDGHMAVSILFVCFRLVIDICPETKIFAKSQNQPKISQKLHFLQVSKLPPKYSNITEKIQKIHFKYKKAPLRGAFAYVVCIFCIFSVIFKYFGGNFETCNKCYVCLIFS